MDCSISSAHTVTRYLLTRLTFLCTRTISASSSSDEVFGKRVLVTGIFFHVVTARLSVNQPLRPPIPSLPRSKLMEASSSSHSSSQTQLLNVRRDGSGQICYDIRSRRLVDAPKSLRSMPHMRFIVVLAARENLSEQSSMRRQHGPFDLPKAFCKRTEDYLRIN